MQLIKETEANPNTKILAWWYKIIKQEFENIKRKSEFNNSPTFFVGNKNNFRTFWNKNFDLTKYQDG